MCWYQYATLCPFFLLQLSDSRQICNTHQTPLAFCWLVSSLRMSLPGSPRRDISDPGIAEWKIGGAPTAGPCWRRAPSIDS